MTLKRVGSTSSSGARVQRLAVVQAAEELRTSLLAAGKAGLGTVYNIRASLKRFEICFETG